ncbi:MAG: hypothetical protein HOP10_12365 [Chitinophagaceae bacterium]|nr:hypothetical protein [Chitinophagaceae bacterium]
MIRTIFTLIIFLFVAFQGKTQTDSLKFPTNAKLSEKFQNAINKQTKEYDRLFFHDSSTTKHHSVQFMLDKIDKDSNYFYIFLAEYWIAFHYQEIIPHLIKRITNKKEVGLFNTADLIIWERVQSGHLKFYGHGGISADDLFTIAGRANRLLTKITGENFGIVSMNSDQEFLQSLQQKWIDWFKAL